MGGGGGGGGRFPQLGLVLPSMIQPSPAGELGGVFSLLYNWVKEAWRGVQPKAIQLMYLPI